MLGLEATYLGFGVICILMAVFVYFLVPETKGKTMAELQAMFEGWMTNPNLKVECPQTIFIGIIRPFANYKKTIVHHSYKAKWKQKKLQGNKCLIDDLDIAMSFYTNVIDLYWFWRQLVANIFASCFMTV